VFQEVKKSVWHIIEPLPLKCHVLFELPLKASSKMLVKLTPRGQTITSNCSQFYHHLYAQILRAHIPKVQKTVKSSVSCYAFGICAVPAKAACKLLVKWSPLVNLTSILWVPFAPIFFWQKLQSQTVSKENCKKHFWMKKLLLKC